MKRRHLLLGCSVIALGACETSGSGQTPARTAQMPVQDATGPARLVYVSATDCVWCERWEREGGAAFEASPIRTAIDMRKILVGSFRTSRVRWEWPSADRGIFDQLMARNARTGLPLFIIMRGDQVVASGSGTREWQTVVLPLLEREAAGNA